MATTKEEILDAISEMSVMDVVDLVKLMEEKFGASPVVQEAPVESNKVGEPLDIANAALYLASDESKFVNGAQIRVDNAMSVVSGNMPE